jgi:hypothetical protein
MVEVELILHCDSMTELIKLAYTSRRIPTMMACMTWIAINFVSKIVLI